MIKILAGVLGVLVLAGGFVTYRAYARLKEIDPDILLQFGNHDDDPTNDVPLEEVQYNGETYYRNQNIVTLMLIGTDASDRSDREGLGARSDLMTVVAIDIKTNQVKMILCPRDTYAEIRWLNKDGSVKDNVMNKLNAAFPYGCGNQDDEMGAENVMYCVGRLLSCDGKYNIELTKYGGINMDGIGPLTTAVGGVDVTLEQDFAGIGKKGQTVTLNASKALTYCVERKSNGLDGSDTSRGKRQMTYLLGLAKKIKSMEVTSVPGVYSKVNQYAFTNLNTDEIVAYAKLLSRVSLDNIQITQLTGKNAMKDGRSVVVLDEEMVNETVLDAFYTKDPNVARPTATPQ